MRFAIRFTSFLSALMLCLAVSLGTAALSRMTPISPPGRAGGIDGSGVLGAVSARRFPLSGAEDSARSDNDSEGWNVRDEDSPWATFRVLGQTHLLLVLGLGFSSVVRTLFVGRSVVRRDSVN